jgi:hypothetical protein
VHNESAHGSAEFFLGDDDEPALVFPGHVGEVLDSEGVWQELNVRIDCDPGDFFDRYEAYLVTVDRLELLASACRDLSQRFETGMVFERHSSERGVIVARANGDELRAALLGLADLADRAKSQGQTISAALL